ncbi:TPA: hypothetical protein NKS80_001463 [Vibrio parahaemolyticus]|uniref:Glycosyltransferase n=1 Tax=Vibrio parahaemolyticus TaxID=670 RepID=A0A7M1W6J8_VIBPH|nr:hypothetical protein VP433_00017 [Vibrio parahaemolyticus]HCH2615921.1 hypothetical protein [Vibrio parahaemolyticus]HCM1483312.1 hypothetical protein [Vibrio parahaemolyticus]
MSHKIKMLVESVLYTFYYFLVNLFSCKSRKSKSTKVVVSLTTYPKRISTVFLTIESIFNQDVNEDYIVVLYLSKEEFKGTALPSSLIRLQNRGLVIKFVDGNIKSYKKLHYAIIKYLYFGSKIITADDDILYPNSWLRKLLETSNENPGCVCYYRGREIKFNNEGKILTYNSLPLANSKSNRMMTIPTGVSGILYPPYSLHEDVLKKDIFLDLAPNADDLWYKTMSLMKGTECVMVTDKSVHFPPILGTQITSLRSTNLCLSSDVINNDTQLGKLVDFYKINFTNK